jgi:predicted patatin/cPLA2 family phospholipase
MKEEGRALVIQPLTDLDCTSLEKSTAKLEAIYQLGYRQGLDMADKVKEFIE